jgi:hypothetical protein
MNGERKIKRFSDFDMDPKMRKLMNRIIAEGKTKPGLFRRPKDFEIQIYYTPMKKKIFSISLTGVDENELNLSFGKGDDLLVATKWLSDNECVIKLHHTF